MGGSFNVQCVIQDFDEEQRKHSPNKVLYCIVLYCIVLMGWSLLPNALRPFQIYCAPPNLGITKM
jgi:hypothetical protein